MRDRRCFSIVLVHNQQETVKQFGNFIENRAASRYIRFIMKGVQDAKFFEKHSSLETN